MKYRVEEGNRVIVNAEADVFVVPNRACTIDGFFSCAQKEIKDNASSILGKDPEDNEMYIDSWITSKDLESDNIRDHGFSVGNFYGGIDTRYLPKSIFNGHKEGDVVEIKFADYDLGAGYTMELHLNCRLNQKDYRYRSFGTFEEVLDRVCK